MGGCSRGDEMNEVRYASDEVRPNGQCGKVEEPKPLRYAMSRRQWGFQGLKAVFGQKCEKSSELV